MKKKIIIPSVIAVLAFAVIASMSSGTTNEISAATTEPPISMVIEDNNYVMGGLLPPDDYILDIGEMLDLEDNRGENSPYYANVKDLFPGYDKIVIIDHVWENPNPTYDEPLTTHIFLTKEPAKRNVLQI